MDDSQNDSGAMIIYIEKQLLLAKREVDLEMYISLLWGDGKHGGGGDSEPNHTLKGRKFSTARNALTIQQLAQGKG